MDGPCCPLIEILGEAVDLPQARGKRYPVAALLTLARVVALCGYQSYGLSPN